MIRLNFNGIQKIDDASGKDYIVKLVRIECGTECEK